MNDIFSFLGEISNPRGGSKNPINRLPSIIAEFVRNDQDSNGSKKIQSLLNSIVYIVFNYSPLNTPSKRFFASAINWQNVCPATKHFIENYESRLPEIESSGFVSTMVYNCNNKHSEAAKSFWNSKWHEYYRTTVQGEKRVMLTWNQFLLKGCKHPLYGGISWNVNERERGDDSYINLDNEMLDLLGLNLGCNETNWFQSLLNSSSEPSLNQEVVRHKQIDEIQKWYSSMNPYSSTLIKKESIVWSVYHLLRSYALWGGNSFFSIPIHIGLDNPFNVAVLSLCSVSPLNEIDVLKWNLIASKLFKDLIAEEYNLDFERNRFIPAVYGMGHAYKNRVNAIFSDLNSLRKSIKKVQGNSEKVQLEKYLRYVSIGVDTLGFFSKLLDVLAAVLQDDIGEQIFIKKKLVSTDPYNVASNLKSISTKLIPTKEQGIYPKLELEFIGEVGFFIDPWINDRYRPADQFYNEILTEILLNVLNHGVCANRKIRAKVYLEKNENENAIVISNEIDQKQMAKLENVFPKKWCSYSDYTENDIVYGGLMYMSLTIEKTKVGKVYVKLDTDESKFLIGLSFKGTSI